MPRHRRPRRPHPGGHGGGTDAGRTDCRCGSPSSDGSSPRGWPCSPSSAWWRGTTSSRWPCSTPLTAVLYLPAWVVAVVALVGRRFVLAGAALLVVVAQILFLLPELTAAEPVPSWAATAPSIRLFDANVYDENPSMAGYAAQIKAYKPQLLTMEEADHA